MKQQNETDFFPPVDRGRDDIAQRKCVTSDMTMSTAIITNSSTADKNANPSARWLRCSAIGHRKGKGVEVKQSALDEVVLGIKSAAARIIRLFRRSN